MPRARAVLLAVLCALPLLAACGGGSGAGVTLHWYVAEDTAGSYRQAAQRCSEASAGRYRIRLEPLPQTTDTQRELLVRRLAARDRTVDIMGMDVIWTAEFAEARWLRPWTGARAAEVSAGVLAGPLATARYRGTLWAAPFTSNTQLLWYRRSRTPNPPATWDQVIAQAEALPAGGNEVAVQGGRYEGYTVWVNSLLASAGTELVADADRPDRARAALAPGPTRDALAVIRRLASSPVADGGLSVATEVETEQAMVSGRAAFSVDYASLYAAVRDQQPTLLPRPGLDPLPAGGAGTGEPAAAGRDQPRRRGVLAPSRPGPGRRRLPALGRQPAGRGRPAAASRRPSRPCTTTRPWSAGSRSPGCCGSASSRPRRDRRPRRTATCRWRCSRCCTRRPRSTRTPSSPGCAGPSTTPWPPRRCCDRGRRDRVRPAAATAAQAAPRRPGTGRPGC